MSGDQLITAVGRTLYRHPDHADLQAAVAIDRDQRCRGGTDELACDFVDFHDVHCVLLIRHVPRISGVYLYDEQAVHGPTARQQINRLEATAPLARCWTSAWHQLAFSSTKTATRLSRRCNGS